jgi:hypothetical protein
MLNVQNNPFDFIEWINRCILLVKIMFIQGPILDIFDILIILIQYKLYEHLKMYGSKMLAWLASKLK